MNSYRVFHTFFKENNLSGPWEEKYFNSSKPEAEQREKNLITLTGKPELLATEVKNSIVLAHEDIAHDPEGSGVRGRQCR